VWGSLGSAMQKMHPTRSPASCAIQAASRAVSWDCAKSATIRTTSASKSVSQPNSLAYVSPWAVTTQPRSPGCPTRRIIAETVVSVAYHASIAQRPSARRDELLELAYDYVKERGLAELSLRPLAKAIGSSPRVLLFLFGSKDGLVRALLARARSEELTFVTTLSDDAELVSRAHAIWSWLAAADHAPLLGLWTEAYARSLLDHDGPWTGFARETVEDWLALLSRDSDTQHATLILAVLRGAMLDLLATGDRQRTTAAVELALSHESRRVRDQSPRSR